MHEVVRYERALLALYKMFRFLVIFETSGSFCSEKRSLNILPEITITFSSKLDKQEGNELILSCYKRKRGNELNFRIHREHREATSTGSLKKILTLKSIYSFKMLIR